METVIYVDVLFLVNWMMDSVILILTGHFLKRRIRLWAVSLAAAAGALWACLYMALGSDHVWLKLLGLGPVAAGMTALAYPPGSVRELLRSFLCLYLAAVLMGGLIHIVWDGTVFGRFLKSWMTEGGDGGLSIWLLALSMAGSFIAVECSLRYRKLSQNRERIQDVTLFFRGRSLTIPALWDTGNQLYDPFTKAPVHIVELEVCRELLGETLWQAVKEAAAGSWECLPSGVRLIPCKSVGAAHGLLPVMSVDRMKTAEHLPQSAAVKRRLTGKNSKKRFAQAEDAPVIGFCLTSLSTEKNYRMLLHSQTDK